MPPVSVVLCSYSHGAGNGIAHVDQDLVTGLDPSVVAIRLVVLRADWPGGRRETLDGALHISLADAYDVLREELAATDLLHVNGAFDPVACHAAGTAGVPSVIEVMHQVEPGGLHEDIDLVVCVSELVRSVQTHDKTKVVHNGIDTEKFAFQPGRRDAELIRVIQVSNRSKKQHYELGDVVRALGNPKVRALMVGDRHPVAGTESLGLVRDMPRVYHQADIHFLIEKRSALGLVFLEGLACGTLPVVSADSGAAAVLQQERAGWVVDPSVKGREIDALREAVATAGTAEFLRMQQRGRALVEKRFDKKQMLSEYQSLYQEWGHRPRRVPKRPGAWMRLALFAQLHTAKNTREALSALSAFLEDSRPVEPHFLRHPLGNSCIALLLSVICPALRDEGHARLVTDICKKLRQSRCVSPLLDALERNP